MKKIIFKIAAGALLVGGLAFNFAINGNVASYKNVDLSFFTKTNVAYGEDPACPGGTTNSCKWDGKKCCFLSSCRSPCIGGGC